MACGILRTAARAGMPVACALACAAASACDVPDEGGNTPWRRAVAKVRHLPETEAMAQLQPDRSVLRYVVALDAPRHLGGRCWWPVEVHVDGKLWKRYLVTPQGDALREERAAAPTVRRAF